MTDSEKLTAPLKPTWRDLLDEDNALEILNLRDRVFELEADRDAYREIATASIHALHQAQCREVRLRRIVQGLHKRVKTLQPSQVRSVARPLSRDAFSQQPTKSRRGKYLPPPAARDGGQQLSC